MDVPNPDQLKVLVVDDDELNQRMMTLILTREGHHVHIASDGRDALETVKQHEFDIILMDLQMPVMDGIEASRRIRAYENGGRTSYIVALTASYLPEKGQELFEAGIDNYIAKPFDVVHLRQMLDYGLDYRKTRRAMASRLAVAENKVPSTQELDVAVGIKMVGGDEETYRELLADYVGKLSEQYKNIERCFAENDLKGLARIAHNIRGVSSNLGALQLYKYAERLEKEVGEGYTGARLENTVGQFWEVSRKFMMTASDFLANAQDKAE
jgi:two-component system, sensor histidine kinase and response regulator